MVRLEEKTARKEKEKQEMKEVKKERKEESNAKRAAEKLAEKANKIAAKFQKYVSGNNIFLPQYVNREIEIRRYANSGILD